MRSYLKLLPLLALLATACGFKGDLYLPDATAPAPASSPEKAQPDDQQRP